MSEDHPSANPQADQPNNKTENNATRINIESEDVAISVEESSEQERTDPPTADHSTGTGTVADLIVVVLHKQSKCYARNFNAAPNIHGTNLNRRPVAVYFGKVFPTPKSDPDAIPLDYDPDYRNDFIRIVFLITGLMLLVTASLSVLTFNSEGIQKFFHSKPGLIMVFCCMLVNCLISYVMSCSLCSRKAPCSYICLFIACTSMSYVVAFITTRHDTKVVLMSFVSSGVICIICLALACTSFDFTAFSVIVLVAGLALGAGSLGVGIAKIFGVNMKPLHIALLLGMLIWQSVSLIITLQMILGGKTVELAEDDYALAAYMLYMSIIEIFIKIIQLLSDR